MRQISTTALGLKDKISGPDLSIFLLHLRIFIVRGKQTETTDPSLPTVLSFKLTRTQVSPVDIYYLCESVAKHYLLCHISFIPVPDYDYYIFHSVLHLWVTLFLWHTSYLCLPFSSALFSHTTSCCCQWIVHCLTFQRYWGLHSSLVKKFEYPILSYGKLNL